MFKNYNREVSKILGVPFSELSEIEKGEVLICYNGDYPPQGAANIVLNMRQAAMQKITLIVPVDPNEIIRLLFRMEPEPNSPEEFDKALRNFGYNPDEIYEAIAAMFRDSMVPEAGDNKRIAELERWKADQINLRPELEGPHPPLEGFGNEEE